MAALIEATSGAVTHPHMAITRSMNVAATQTIYKGAIVFMDASGDAIVNPGTLLFPVMGFAQNTVDNSSGALTTNKPLLIWFNHVVDVTMTDLTLQAGELIVLPISTDNILDAVGGGLAAAGQVNLIGQISEVLSSGKYRVHITLTTGQIP